MGAPGAGAPLFSNTSTLLAKFYVHTDHTALAYRFIEPPFIKSSSYACELTWYNGSNHVIVHTHTNRLLVNLSYLKRVIQTQQI